MKYDVRPVTDEAVWEAFVLTHSPHALFQSWPWGEVQIRCGQVVRRYGLYEGERLRAIMQTVDVRARRGHFLHVRHGPVLDKPGDARLWHEVLAFLAAAARRNGMLFVRMNPVLEESPALHSVFTAERMQPAAIHRMDGEQCWVLDLDPSEEALLNGMRKTIRYEIRHAAKDGVEIVSTADPDRISSFMRLYDETSKRQGFVPHKGIREEFSIFGKRGQAVLYLGSVGGRVLSGALILRYGNQAIYHHGASVPSKVPVSAAVQWQAIRDAKAKGMPLYNFWGIAPENSPNHPWRGITLFKKGFGGREVNTVHAHDLPVSPLYVFPRAVERFRRLTKGYD